MLQLKLKELKNDKENKKRRRNDVDVRKSGELMAWIKNKKCKVTYSVGTTLFGSLCCTMVEFGRKGVIIE